MSEPTNEPPIGPKLGRPPIYTTKEERQAAAKEVRRQITERVKIKKRIKNYVKKFNTFSEVSKVQIITELIKMTNQVNLGIETGDI